MAGPPEIKRVKTGAPRCQHQPDARVRHCEGMGNGAFPAMPASWAKRQHVTGPEDSPKAICRLQVDYRQRPRSSSGTAPGAP